MTKYADIIARLEKAAGPDREIDWKIADAINFPEEWMKCNIWPPFMKGSPADKQIPRYTASIDAALALVERMLPGAELEMSNLYGVARVTLHDVENSFHSEDHCNRLQTALLIAIFRALDAKEET